MVMAAAQPMMADAASPSGVPPELISLVPSAHAPSDALLITQISQGHEPALGALYDRYSRLVYAVALRITNDQSSAEEVVQDVFSAVWKSAQRFRAGSNVKSWLNGITQHRAIDTTRVRHFRAHAAMMRLEEFHSLSTPTDLETQVLDVLDCEQLWHSLLALSPAQRTTIKLAYYVGFTPREIAKYTGVPLGTVKTRLRLGLSKLRAILGEQATSSSAGFPMTQAIDTRCP